MSNSQFREEPEDDTESYNPFDDDAFQNLPDSVKARAPKDPDAIANPDDLLIRHGDDGEVEPVWEPLPGTGTDVCVKPMSEPQADDWFGENFDPSEMDDAQAVALLKEFYVWPDFEARGVETAADMNRIVAFGMDPLLNALLNASGMGIAQGAFAENSELLELVQGNLDSKTGN